MSRLAVRMGKLERNSKTLTRARLETMPTCELVRLLIEQGEGAEVWQRLITREGFDPETATDAEIMECIQSLE